MAKQTFTTGQVLTAAQMTSLQQTAMLGGAASAKTASYTLVAADAGTAISMSNASATTITVNTALFAAGDTVQITNLGAGVCTITAGTATVNTSASLALAQYESGTLDFTSTSAAIFIKGAGAAAASGGMTLLSTTSLSGTSTTVSAISGLYNDLYVYIEGATASANAQPKFKPNNAVTVLTVSEKAASDGYTTGIFTAGGASTTAQNYVFNIKGYAGTTYPKPIFLYGYYQGQTAGIIGGGYSSETGAITSIVFETGSAATWTAGQIRIYGVK